MAVGNLRSQGVPPFVTIGLTLLVILLSHHYWKASHTYTRLTESHFLALHKSQGALKECQRNLQMLTDDFESIQDEKTRVNLTVESVGCKDPDDETKFLKAKVAVLQKLVAILSENGQNQTQFNQNTKETKRPDG